MLTFVVDVHHDRPGPGSAASALLYPFRARGQVVRLSYPEASQSKRRLASLRQVVRTRLQRMSAGSRDWRVLFLLDDARGDAPAYRTGLAGQFRAVRRHVLRPLRDRHNQRPALCLGIYIDEHERDSWFAPGSSACRLRWKLDLYGMVLPDRSDENAAVPAGGRSAPGWGEIRTMAKDQYPFLLTDDDLQTFDDAWEALHRSSGVRRDESVNALRDDDLRQKIRGNLKKLGNKIGEIIDQKKKALPDIGPDAPVPLCADADVLDRLREDFIERLNRLGEGTLGDCLDFLPGRELRRMVRDRLSLRSQLVGRPGRDVMALLRFPLRRMPPQRLQQDLVRFDYLLAALAATPSRNLRETFVPNASETRAHATATDTRPHDEASVVLDHAVLRRTARWAERRLERGGERLRDALDDLNAYELDMLQVPDASCSVTLSEQPWGRLLERFDHLKAIRQGRVALAEWVDEVHEDLEGRQREAGGQLRECARASRAQFQHPATEKASGEDIEAETEQRERVFDRHRQALLDASPAPFTNDWREEVAGVSQELTDLLRLRPSPAWVGLSLLMCAGLALPPLFLSFPSGAPTTALLVGGASLAVLILLVPLLTALGRLRRDLRGLWRDACAIAKGVREALRANVDRREDKLDAFLKARFAQENLRRARKKQREAGDRRARLDYHRSRMNTHRESAETLQRLFGGAAPPRQDKPQVDDIDAQLQAPDAPEQENEIYHLLLASEDSPNAQPASAFGHRVDGKILPGLKEIEVKSDAAYDHFNSTFDKRLDRA